MNKIAVFLETTLIVEEAIKLLPKADYFPSAKKGDILGAVKDKYSTIVIIDGSFNWSASIWHKEILIALNKGIIVFGCSSMGALRASETDSLGMIGHGEVYLMYKNGLINGDDEVAISYNFETKEKTIPMINLRKTIETLSLPNSEKLINDCRDIFYANRNWDSLKKHIGESAVNIIYNNYIDIKKNDAVSLLVKIREDSLYSVNKSKSVKSSTYTFFEKEMIEEKFGVKLVDFAKSLPTIELIKLERIKLNKSKGLIRLTDTENNKENLFLFYKLICYSELSGFYLSRDHVVDMVFKFRENHGLLSGEQFYNWISERYLSTTDLISLFHEFFLIKKLYKVKFNYNKYFL